MQGTVFQPNIFDRLGNAWRAWKALPSPGQLYPPQQGIQGGFLTFPGWDYLEKNGTGNSQDEQRTRKAVQSPSVFANMRAIATEFASSELVIKERKAEALEDVDNHPLELLWEAPNPDMGRSFVMEFWAWSYTLPGKAYLYWLPAGGAIKEIWPIPPFMIRPVPASKDFIGGYAFKSRPDADPIMIPREYITYSHSVNIFDARDSLSFLVAGMTPIESEVSMGLWNRNFFDEGNGIPDGLISVNKDTLDSDLARIRQEIRDFFGGTKRGLAIARETDMKYQPWGRTQKDAEFTEGTKLVSTQIGRLMGFPDGYWSESANRANAEQARATMIAGAVWPLLVRLSEDMNAGVVRRWWGDQYRAEFKDIRPEDRQLKIAELTFYSQIETVNELRKRIGSDPLEDPRGEMFIVEIGKGTPIPATPAAEMTDEALQEQEDEVAQLEAEAGMGEGGEEAEPMEETTEEGPPMEEEAPPVKTVSALDLSRWERKALKALKAGRGAGVRFDSVAIAPEEHERISAALAEARTVEAVKAAFTKAEDVDSLLDGEWSAAMKWAQQVRGD